MQDASDGSARIAGFVLKTVTTPAVTENQQFSDADLTLDPAVLTINGTAPLPVPLSPAWTWLLVLMLLAPSVLVLENRSP